MDKIRSFLFIVFNHAKTSYHRSYNDSWAEQNDIYYENGNKVRSSLKRNVKLYDIERSYVRRYSNRIVDI